MASTVSVPMEEVFGDWGQVEDSTGQAPPHHTPPAPTSEWEHVPMNTGFTMDSSLGTQQYMNPPLQPSPFETVQSMDVDESGDPHISPPASPPHPATEVPDGEQADYDVEEDPHQSHQVGGNSADHPWGPPLAEEDEVDEDDDLTLTLGVGEDAEDEVPLDSLTLEETPAPVTSKRDISQVTRGRKSSNPAAYPQWTAGSKSNKIGESPHPDWHHPSNNMVPDPSPQTGAAESSGGRDTHPIYLAG
eukprot:353347-Amphidinium_carterae.1